MPIPSLDPGAAVITDEMGLPPNATANPLCRASLRRRNDSLDRGRRQDVGRLVELDHGIGDVTIRSNLVDCAGRERTSDADDVGQGLQTLHHPIDRSPVGLRSNRSGGVEDDVGGVPRSGGESRLQNVGGLL